MPGVLTIETGIAGNNRCGYRPLRRFGPARSGLLPSTEEVERRIRLAREAGFEELAFTGGEPTIRPDFLRLVAAARAAGFGRVSVTTNGRMFAYRDLCKRAADAGLTGVTVSVHGPDATTHDGLTGVPGSFGQMVRGLGNLRRLGGRVTLHSVTILVPQNLSRLRNTLLLAGAMGVGLHIVQPFTAARENLDVAGRYLLTLDEIAAGLEAALAAGLPHGGRVRPYNIPPCILDPVAGLIEPARSRVRTVRAFDSGLEPMGPQPVFFARAARCVGCGRDCRGPRIEQLPRDEVVEDVLAGARSALRSGGALTVAAMDLLDEPGVRAVLHGMRKMGPARVRPVHGGHARARFEDLVGAAREAGVDEVCFLVWPETLRMPDRGAWLPGNVDRVMELLALFAPGARPRPSLMVDAGALVCPDFSSEDRVPSLLSALVASGGDTLYLTAAETQDPAMPPRDPAFKASVVAALPGVLAHARERGVRVLLVRAAKEVGQDRPGSMERMVAEVLPTEEWSQGFARHRFTDTAYGWLLWSYPMRLFHVPGPA